ncbi:hypothetical protein M0R04_12550 [Candidatus Dojkabacteria bacterium]|jgi:hypothetical protein|nr:hypothetical protein [Candidatus Dojkabacteria bacterium]
MKNKLHGFFNIHDWTYGAKYETSYRSTFLNHNGIVVDGGTGYQRKQDRTCKICGKIETITLDQ